MTDSTISSEAELRARVAAQLPGVLRDLKRLISIRSVSSLPEHAMDVRASADAVASLLTGVGCPDVRIIAEGGLPAVIGRFPAPEGAPTVCLYAHHDVQPTGDLESWHSAPFEATERDGRIVGRGAADDKGGIAVHLAALRAFDGKPPVGVTVFVEGEEEIGSPTIGAIIERHQDLLRADAYVIADSVNWDVGAPAFTTKLRGLADCLVEVRTLDHALHSGQYGGVVPDALTALCRLLATLHDEAGNVAVEGLHSEPASDLDYPLDRLRTETGLLDGVSFVGDGTIVERMWTKPAITVIALDATRVADASNTLAPVARAKISLRVAPGGDARESLAALTRHLESHAPWGAHVRVTPGETGEPGIVEMTGPVVDAARAAFADAFDGVAPVDIGCGGSIPMVADFRRAFPGAAVVVSAVVDPDSRMHGADESLNLGDFAKVALAETLFLRNLAIIETVDKT